MWSKKSDDGKSWKVIATDSDWETKYIWMRHWSVELAESYANIVWEIPTWTAPGTYRINHFCEGKTLFSGAITSYQGTTREFKVTA